MATAALRRRPGARRMHSRRWAHSRRRVQQAAAPGGAPVVQAQSAATRA